MLGLIVKVFGFIIALIAATLMILSLTNVATPGTLSFSEPAVEPCQRVAQGLKRPPIVVEVRWIWTSQEYGWGCHFEYGDDSTGHITPMPN